MIRNGGDAEDKPTYRILSLDGGGIRGVFPAAFLAKLQENLEHPIASYFDLITGTSTGGIIAIGLGLGMSAADILRLYEEQGPAIFDQQHGPMTTWVRQKSRALLHLFGSKYSSDNLEAALKGVLGSRKLGESKTRLVIPAWHPMLERVYIYKTAHHPRLETDYKQPAIDAAMATAAAPTFLKPHMTSESVELVDGGVWAKPKWKGKLPMATSVTRLFMAGQSHSAMGAAMIITGDGHDYRAIWRIDQTAPEGRYTLDNASRIAEMKDRATTEARQQLPELRRAFFQTTAEPFVPFHSL
jgi:hypothetical protein